MKRKTIGYFVCSRKLSSCLKVVAVPRYQNESLGICNTRNFVIQTFFLGIITAFHGCLLTANRRNQKPACRKVRNTGAMITLYVIPAGIGAENDK